jgi:tRNA nucleotidyltransferase (CCA-adding enzyme)
MDRHATMSHASQPQPARANVQELMIRHLPARNYILLEAAGRLADEMEVPAFVVGGIVRDLLLGAGTFDLDLVVEGDGIAFARAFARDTGGLVTTHDRFGTATVQLDDGPTIDIATARKESYAQPAALPLVVPAAIQDDLLRRDFTINALAVRLNPQRFGEMVDACHGQGDIAARRIRVLHRRSFLDDPTRMFRAIRFERRLGFRMDRSTLVLLREAVATGVLAHLSGRRLSEELRRMLSEAHPTRAVARMGELGILRAIHPKLAWSKKLEGVLKGVEQAVAWHARNLPKRKVNVWLPAAMALLEGLPPKSVTDILKRLALPRHEAEAIRAGHAQARATLCCLAKRPAPKPSAIYRTLTDFTEETVLFLLALAKSESVKRLIMAYVTAGRHVKPSLTGADLKALGLKPGPQFKKILGRLLDARLDGDVKNEAGERELVRKLVRA